MTLIMALILEQASGPVVAIFGTARPVDVEVWAALWMMGLVFGVMLATLLGILTLHVRYDAEYRYWYVVLDNVFVTVPLFVAVRFIASSINATPGSAVHLDETLFRIGATLIAVSYVALSVRDAVALPKIPVNLSPIALWLVGAMHVVGALLFFLLAAVPGVIVLVALIGSVGLVFFFVAILVFLTFEPWFKVVGSAGQVGAKA